MKQIPHHFKFEVAKSRLRLFQIHDERILLRVSRENIFQKKNNRINVVELEPGF